MSQHKIKIARGDTRKPTYTITGLGENSSVGTTFFTVNAEGSDDDATAILKLDSVNQSAQFAYPATDKITVTLLPANTSGVAPGAYKYDLQQVLIGGDVRTLARDDFVVERDYTTRTTT